MLAQEPSTIVLKSGERISAELIDMNGAGFAVRVNGQDRTIGIGDVASVEFVVGPIPGDAQNRVNEGQQMVVLRSGEVVQGRLSDVGGTRPLRLTVDTPSGQRDFNSSDVAQIYLSGQMAEHRRSPRAARPLQAPARRPDHHGAGEPAMDRHRHYRAAAANS